MKWSRPDAPDPQETEGEDPTAHPAQDSALGQQYYYLASRAAQTNSQETS